MRKGAELLAAMISRFSPTRFRPSDGVIALLAAVGLAVYLAASALLFRIGFPLDDAWIHQTYARNLAMLGEWAFIPGESSAGSTAPLWTAILAPGYWLGLSPYAWTWMLGWAALCGIGLVSRRIFQQIQPENPIVSLWVAIFIVLEWHLVWAAGSGMETLLFALIILVAFAGLFSERKRWFELGLLVGISLWVRPDGLTLAGPVIFVATFGESSWKSRIRAIGLFALGALILAAPYLWFNRALSGAWWPNTFFAKQAEYAIHRQQPLLNRFLQQTGMMLIGAGVVLLPGLFIQLQRSIRRREWALLASAAWLLGFLLLYAIRLAVVYQHGRYVIPAMPVFFLISLAGLASWVKSKGDGLWKRVIGRAWALSLGLVWLAFFAIGARAYALDVAVIESEMVETAKWVVHHTDPDALIAAHDIGALGYFAERRLIDLAGLVSPEVIPFIRDEAALAAYMDENQVDYFVSFPGWYPELVVNRISVYTSNGPFSPMQGGENMQVFRWR